MAKTSWDVRDWLEQVLRDEGPFRFIVSPVPVLGLMAAAGLLPDGAALIRVTCALLAILALLVYATRYRQMKKSHGDLRANYFDIADQMIGHDGTSYEVLKWKEHREVDDGSTVVTRDITVKNTGHSELHVLWSVCKGPKHSDITSYQRRNFECEVRQTFQSGQGVLCPTEVKWNKDSARIYIALTKTLRPGGTMSLRIVTKWSGLTHRIKEDNDAYEFRWHRKVEEFEFVARFSAELLNGADLKAQATGITGLDNLPVEKDGEARIVKSGTIKRPDLKAWSFIIEMSG